ncbi:MAG: hypothetical protein HYW79_03480 [Parcubacteria group bacterium]|nr:hypothetical protein [Parcubacteria group bacterium]
MDNQEKRFRGRIFPRGEGIEEIPFDQNADTGKNSEDLMRQLQETRDALKDINLPPDRLSELWKRQRDLEKKLDLDEKKEEEPTTGVYL